MDLELDENQRAIADLAHQILREALTRERLRAIEATDDRVGAEEWKRLADAGLLGVPLAEDVGGMGMGIVEACLVLEQIGRTVAPLPYLATVVGGAMPIDAFGSPAQRARILPRVSDGSLLLAPTLIEEGNELATLLPSTTARRDGIGWRLDGEKRVVAAAHVADLLLVPARTADDASAVFLVDPGTPGVTIERAESTTGEPLSTVRLTGVRVTDEELLGDERRGAEIVAWIVRRVTAGLCAMQAGVCAEALRLTAAHVSEREQFGQKIATFQAVAQRAADAYIDTEAVMLTARQAAWRLGAGLDADEALDTAKFWAADGGFRVAHAAQHLHGGIGVDTEYPLFRYFRRTRQIELTLGGAALHLVQLGGRIAARAATRA
ncbi:MAG TPA: acyl-CoA dehydrogenase family protein [Candidatus Binatia bacterium]|jgi:alkylation response protein AidB-like acyl-CoA dehydrogenase|nr:acyl-CoA dehydrogenase family protein [Candidatus Binatia bacterium]